MALNNFTPQAPRVGKISLGVKKTTSSGTKYPTTTEYFVLDHLDEDFRKKIIDIYGPEPRELDIMFPSDDIDQIIPTFLKWYSGGSKNDKGDMGGGRLRCYGDGPDKNGNPGRAVYLDKRDPITRIAPSRDCLGPRCKDWFGPNGKQQCSQMMQVFCMLPRVSYYGVFVISTRSWYSIRSFHDMIHWVKGWNDGVVKGIPLKIARDEESIQFTDSHGSLKTSKQYIMKLFPNEGFEERCGSEVTQKLRASFRNGILLPTADEVLELPEAPVVDTSPVIEHPKVTSESLMKDEIIVDLFDQLEVATRKAFSEKARFLAIRKLEGSADLRAAVIETLTNKIRDARAEQVAILHEPSVVAETTQAEVPPPAIE